MATERIYLHWVKRFILFHGKRHPETMGKKEVEGFLTHLAVNRQVAPSTQNVALAAILFLYPKVLGVKLPWLDDVVRAKPKRRIPVVLNSEELSLLLKNCRSTQFLPVSIMYGAGLRLSECTRLRVGDLDFTGKPFAYTPASVVKIVSVFCRKNLRPAWCPRLPL
jgi:integrase